MLIGIDVGGTHTDAVAVESGKVVASGKVATVHDDLLSSVLSALEIVLEAVSPEEVTRLNLSTTLSTNAIVEGRTDEVGVIVSSGPGIDPYNFQTGKFYFPVKGSIDHRGEEIASVPENEIVEALDKCVAAGVTVFAAVSKFSTRNPSHEEFIAETIASKSDVISLGHRFSGQLDFPRRIATAYYNSAVWRLYNNFADAVEAGVRAKGITAPVNILKADGGTMPLERSRELPVESILSGPAASVMGVLAQQCVCGKDEQGQEKDTLILDIGGTTTDIALLVACSPLVEKDGIAVGSFPTLVHALKTCSIGVGGDSALHYSAGSLRVGPERNGVCMAEGGSTPALMDALIYCGHASFGDVDSSRKGIELLAEECGMKPSALAESAMTLAVKTISRAVHEFIKEVNSTPVYTIREILRGDEIVPDLVSIMGGPAEAFQKLLAEELQMPVETVPQYAVANAIGAAMTKPTFELELFADTEARTLFIPVVGERRRVPSTYKLLDAVLDAKEALMNYFAQRNIAIGVDDIEVTEEQSFNMVGDYGTVGRNIRVKCQIRPGVEI
ncbi:hydantoinase/oxoprolinase family protein [Halodesulfovibrio marinisediminis]|uniref:N-methylhydantoinase A/oxoprolinase/acetone carboxylase, beta subunit n=1 Tax=Halodesulfovibrio marinisediminis DSM 17456 TaxID=1121457 RepID=A0A1N6DRE8_9BACT|nr:hydantoinase/oxoprolinase family protein [Halodesulfovibrio marinisediminis]SIN73320.1 N-methylhydantoinase A/oxoprolinase/acetone carboxylase, beta subunit [Halodesulfovibrio marinisediminis DSM 17456]